VGEWRSRQRKTASGLDRDQRDSGVRSAAGSSHFDVSIATVIGGVDALTAPGRRVATARRRCRQAQPLGTADKPVNRSASHQQYFRLR
jgi:hypothetical protein